MNLADIRKFTAQLAPRILIHGPEGVGKTTIASKFPSPIFLQTEDGCPSGMEINSFGLIDNFADLRSAIGALASEQHHFQTVVIDSLDATEELIWRDVCRSQGWSSIESPGYGKGYVIVESWWLDILKGLDYLRRRRRHDSSCCSRIPRSRRSTIRAPPVIRPTSCVCTSARAAWCRTGATRSASSRRIFTCRAKKSASARSAIAPTAARSAGCTSKARPSFVAKNRYGLPAKMPVPKDFSYGALAPYLPPQPSAAIDGKPNPKPNQTDEVNHDYAVSRNL